MPKGYSDDRQNMAERLSRRPTELVERTWARTVTLAMWVPGQWWASRLFWDAERATMFFYYVDFVRPMQINEPFIDMLDLALDIVVEPNGGWTLKDEAEYQQFAAAGVVQRTGPREH